jgi:hypothetical protein
MAKRKKPKKGGKMSKEVSTKETSAVTAYSSSKYEGSGPHISSDDLVIPKILPVQHTSDKAKDKTSEAEAGEFRDTLEDKKFGDVDTSFEFIPLHMITFWAEYDVTQGGQGKYITHYPCSAGNENLLREEVVEGKKIKRIKTYECYCLIPSEVESGSAFPYVLSFRVTSAKAGKNMLTQMYLRNKMAGKPPFGTVCELSLSEESNDHGDFFVQHVKPVRSTSLEELKEADKWFKMINAGQVKKDDSDLHTDASVTVEQVNTAQF